MDTKKIEVADTTMPSHDIAEGETVDASSLAKAAPLDDIDEQAEALRNYVPGSSEEKKLLRKLDMLLLPMLWWMCVLAYLDRNNIGNAEAAGMKDDLGLNDDTYAMLIVIFFIAYVVFEVPSNLVLSRVRPSLFLPGIMCAWGAVVAGMSKTRTYHDILVIRFFLGMIEAGFFPGVLYLMTCWYKREEIGKRFCIFFSALCVAGAISGLISGAVMSGLDGHNGMAGWRWLFLLEGVITIGISIIAAFILPDFPHSRNRYFTPEQRQLAIVRIMHDKIETGPRRRRLTPLQSVHAAVVDLRTYFFIALYLTQNGSSTISYFIPTVLASMGYSGTEKQWMTVPIWAVGIVFLLVFPRTSDYFNDRRWHICGGLTVAFIASIVTLTVDYNDKARYAMLCFYIGGLYTTLPLILNWASELMALPAEKRAVVIAMVNCVGSISSIYGSYLWPSSDAPHYAKGFTTVSVFMAFGACLSASLPIIFRYLPENKTKAMLEIEAEMEAAV